MAEIRLNKIMRQFNIGLQDIVDFLKTQGADVEENPNAKVSDEYMPAIQKQFGADLKAAEEAKRPCTGKCSRGRNLCRSCRAGTRAGRRGFRLFRVAKRPCTGKCSRGRNLCRSCRARTGTGTGT